jgi:hypothetical protein
MVGPARPRTCGTHLVGQVIQQLKVVAILHATPARNHAVGRVQRRAVRLGELGTHKRREGWGADKDASAHTACLDQAKKKSLQRVGAGAHTR